MKLNAEKFSNYGKQIDARLQFVKRLPYAKHADGFGSRPGNKPVSFNGASFLIRQISFVIVMSWKWGIFFSMLSRLSKAGGGKRQFVCIGKNIWQQAGY